MNHYLKTNWKQMSLLVLFIISLLTNLQSQVSCELNDQIEIIKILDADNRLEITEEYIHGIENQKLESKAQINGSNDLQGTLDKLLVAELSEELFRSDQYKIFTLSLVVTADSKVENFFLISEVFWFVINEDGTNQYSQVSKEDPMEMEMAKNAMGYIELEKIIEIKAFIRDQKWTPGSCNGEAVNTLLEITLNDI